MLQDLTKTYHVILSCIVQVEKIDVPDVGDSKGLGGIDHSRVYINSKVVDTKSLKSRGQTSGSASDLQESKSIPTEGRSVMFISGFAQPDIP